MIPRPRGVGQRCLQIWIPSRPTAVRLYLPCCEYAEISGGKVRLWLNSKYHFQRYPVPAIPVPMAALHAARAESAGTVRVTDTATGRIYEVSAQQCLGDGELCGGCPARLMRLPLAQWRWVNRPPSSTPIPSMQAEADPQTCQPPAHSSGDIEHD